MQIRLFNHFSGFILIIVGLDAKKNCLRMSSSNIGADQPTHPRSLISAFVIRLFESIISRLATYEISIF